MARRRRKPPVMDARRKMDQFRAKVMLDAGYPVNLDKPETVKYEVARAMGIPLRPGYNGKLTTEEAGKVGGRIGGTMVKEMIRLAQQQLEKKQNM